MVEVGHGCLRAPERLTPSRYELPGSYLEIASFPSSSIRSGGDEALVPVGNRSSCLTSTSYSSPSTVIASRPPISSTSTWKRCSPTLSRNGFAELSLQAWQARFFRQTYWTRLAQASSTSL